MKQKHRKIYHQSKILDLPKLTKKGLTSSGVTRIFFFFSNMEMERAFEEMFGCKLEFLELFLFKYGNGKSIWGNVWMQIRISK